MAEGRRGATRGYALALISTLMLAFGIGMTFAGLVALLGGLASIDDAAGPPTCDGEVMRRGEVCHRVTNGNGELVGYEEMARRQEGALPDGLVIGGVGVGGGAVLLLGGWWLMRMPTDRR